MSFLALAQYTSYVVHYTRKHWEYDMSSGAATLFLPFNYARW
jgi:hypothetical protein